VSFTVISFSPTESNSLEASNILNFMELLKMTKMRKKF